MRLKRIALSSIFILALLIMGTEYVVSNYIVRNGFDALERQQVASDVRRVRNEFLSEIEDLDTFLWDWASWDDTYNFVKNENVEYIKSNLPLTTFLEQNLNMVIVLGSDGRSIYARAVDEDGRDDESLINEFQAVIAKDGLPQITPDGKAAGLLVLSDGPLIFAKRPVLTSGGDKSSGGSLIMARFLLDDDIDSISKRLELPIVAQTLNQIHRGTAVPLEQLLAGKKDVISVKDQDTINGFTLLRDVYDQPALVLTVTEPRKVSHHGRVVAIYNTLFIAAILIVFSLLMYLLLQRKVLSRMIHLSKEVQRVDMSRETPMHVTISGDDEISQLAQNVNAMFVQIAEDQKALRRAHDSLERKVAERTAELEEANQELLCLDKAKSHFLSSTSHELRTPLTSIFGFIKLLERSFKKRFQPHLNDVEEATKYIGTHLENFKIVRKETERLGRLISDLLDLNKIEANRVDWRDSDVDVKQLVNSAAKSIVGQFNDNPDIELIVDTPMSLPSLHVDEDRIHQVLINLLNNAAKFTEKGSVTISVQDAGENALEFSVTDTGTGISENDQKQIFEIFYQAQNGSEQYGPQFGTGLGLAICKEIVEHYNGRIWVESEVGKGSAFRFTIPIQTAAASSEQK
ncbi:ATP-binding protein [uncultured Pseudodesulfovibrio sp.]|uniref:sensor histidine kinase n=1 Tax=uncultured Pseudodesulfovibrio sp. TaxID=2035858 RepID=UPI0029C6E094|nr:CHASE4 domain-containing protein [uncultured Pseudodesulfovibrio sp.]